MDGLPPVDAITQRSSQHDNISVCCTLEPFHLKRYVICVTNTVHIVYVDVKLVSHSKARVQVDNLRTKFRSKFIPLKICFFKIPSMPTSSK